METEGEENMIAVIYPFLCILIPCCLYQIYTERKQNAFAGWEKKRLLCHRVWVFLFLLYLYAAFSAAGIGTVWDVGQYDTLIRLDEINLLPFQSEGAMTYVLNIVMFLPLGFLLPYIWKEYRSLKRTAAAGACLSLAIEVCQLFNLRATDVDDLMMNTLGAVFGYLLWYLFHRLFPKAGKDGVLLFSREPEIYLTLSVLGTFLFYNWRWLL